MLEDFRKSYFKRYNKELYKLKLIDKINKSEEEIKLLKRCILEEESRNKFYPLLAGTGNSRLSVLSLGDIPPYLRIVNPSTKHVMYIPNGYSIKKKYFKYKEKILSKTEKIVKDHSSNTMNNSEENKDKMFYFIRVQSNPSQKYSEENNTIVLNSNINSNLTINIDEFIKFDSNIKIESEDHFIFENWNHFLESVDGVGKIHFLDFVGLLNPNILNYIDQIGDLNDLDLK